MCVLLGPAACGKGGCAGNRLLLTCLPAPGWPAFLCACRLSSSCILWCLVGSDLQHEHLACLYADRAQASTCLIRGCAWQGACDVHGTKILHRFVQHRKLVQLMNSARGAPKSKPSEEAASVDPRQVGPTCSALCDPCTIPCWQLACVCV